MGTKKILFLHAGFYQIILIAVLVSVASNLLSNALSSYLTNSVFLQIGISAILMLTAGAGALARYIPFSFDTEFKPVIIFSDDSNLPTVIDRYDFSEYYCRFARSMAYEDAGLRAVWNKNKFAERHISNSDTSPFEVSESGILAGELIEYVFLEYLSTHLTDYFNRMRYEDKRETQIQVFGRVDIPAVLLTNRCLELHSRPMRDRAGFQSFNSDKHHNTVMAFSNGMIFSRFDLVLPSKSKVSRGDDGSVIIDTPRFCFSFRCRLSGANALIPLRFAESYMNVKYDKIFPVYGAISCNIRFKILGLMSVTGWQYYKWIDSFLEYLKSCTDFEQFLSNIGWEQVETMIIVGRESNFGPPKPPRARGTVK